MQIRPGGEKPLKRLGGPGAWYTLLKQGVNERGREGKQRVDERGREGMQGVDERGYEGKQGVNRGSKGCLSRTTL